VYILVGISLIGIVTPWYPSSLSFIVSLFNNGKGISEVAYYIIGNATGPIFVVIWLVVFTKYFYIEYRKYILSVSILYGIFFDIIFFLLLTQNPNYIGDFYPPVDVEFTGLYLILAVSIIMIFFITGIIFSYRSINSENDETRVKGYFLMAAFISYLLGAFLDAAVQQEYLYLFFTRMILISGAMEWFLGFSMPNWLKRRLIKSYDNQ